MSSTSEKIIRTMFLYGSFAIVGMSLALPGSALLDLGVQTGSSVASITSLFIWRYAGTLVGLLVGGPLFDQLNHNFLMVFCFVTLGSTLLALTYCYSLFALSVVYAVDGIAAGIYLVGPTVSCVRIWAEKSGPFLQALWLSPTVGAFITPLIVSHFQLPHRSVLDATTGLTVPEDNTTASQHATTTLNATPENSSLADFTPVVDAHNLDIKYAIYIIMSLCYLMVISHVILFCCDGYQVRYTAIEDDEETDTQLLDKRPRLRTLYIFLFFAMYILTGIVEEIPSSVLTVFVVNYLGWAKSTGAHILSVWWLSVTCSRFAGIFIAKYLRPSCMLMINTCLIIGGSVLMLTLLGSEPVIMWAAIAIIGVGWATQIATAIGWIRAIMEFSSVRASLLLTALFSGKMLAPRFVVFMSEEYSPRWFIYTLLGAGILLLLFQIAASLSLRVCREEKKDSCYKLALPDTAIDHTQSMPCMAPNGIQPTVVGRPRNTSFIKSTHSITLWGSGLYLHDSQRDLRAGLRNIN